MIGGEIQRVVRLKPIRGRAGGLSTANAIAGSREKWGRRALIGLAAWGALAPGVSARLAARAGLLGGRSRRSLLGLLARDRQQHFPLSFDALAALLALRRRGALRLHAAAQRLHQVD